MASTVSFSLRTCIKQFSALSKRTPVDFPIRTRIKRFIVTCNTTRHLHFETLTSRQKDQVHLFVDALLEWNKVLGLSILLVFVVVSFNLMAALLNFHRK